MGLLDRFRPRPGEQDTISLLQESVRDLSLRQEDRGWQHIGAPDHEFTLDALRAAARDGRALAIAHPLVRRGIGLRTAYVHGQGGPQVSVDDTEGQDVNAVVQAWWAARENQGALTGAEARARLERSLSTDGNVFIACFTNPSTGAVVNRTVPFDEIDEIITNPADRLEVWYYKRTYTQRVESVKGTGITTSEQTVTVYYPDLAYAPTRRPTTINGDPVRWAEPIRHVKIGDLDGWLYGLGDTYAIAPYARSYRDFLADWLKLMRSLSMFAWRATADGKRAQRARQAIAAAQRDTADSMVLGTGESLEAIPKTGATIDADSGRPILAMIAAGFDVPVTMLSGDPGVTGARATAETLDEPMLLAMHARRDVWTAVYQDIAEYVIEQAITAPLGGLTGDIVRDPWTRTDTAVLDGEPTTIHVEWPDLSTMSTASLVQAITQADGTGKLPPVTIVRLLCTALGVDDIDAVVDEVTDDDGQWRDPYATDGTRLARAFTDGRDPATALGDFGRFAAEQ